MKKQKPKQGPFSTTMTCPPSLKFSDHFGSAGVSPSILPLPGCPFPLMNAPQRMEVNAEGKLFHSTRKARLPVFVLVPASVDRLSRAVGELLSRLTVARNQTERRGSVLT